MPRNPEQESFPIFPFPVLRPLFYQELRQRFTPWRKDARHSVKVVLCQGTDDDFMSMIDQRYFRPTEVDSLLGDPSKAQEKLGWKAKVSFQELVAEMVQSDLEQARRDALVRDGGFRVTQHHE